MRKNWHKLFISLFVILSNTWFVCSWNIKTLTQGKGQGMHIDAYNKVYVNYQVITEFLLDWNPLEK